MYLHSTVLLLFVFVYIPGIFKFSIWGHLKKKNAQRVENDEIVSTKNTVDDGKERLNHSREKN